KPLSLPGGRRKRSRFRRARDGGPLHTFSMARRQTEVRDGKRVEVTMRAFSKWAAFGSLAGMVLLTACASSSEGAAANVAQAGMNEDPPEVAHMAFIRDALAKVSLRADQKTIVEQLGREADARHEPIRASRLALQGALADQVAAGKIDRALLKPQIDALLQSIEQSR